jgi:hypothetical protein
MYHSQWYYSTTILKPPFHCYGGLRTNDLLRLRLIAIMLKSPLSSILILLLAMQTFYGLGTDEYYYFH